MLDLLVYWLGLGQTVDIFLFVETVLTVRSDVDLHRFIRFFKLCRSTPFPITLLRFDLFFNQNLSHIVLILVRRAMHCICFAYLNGF